MTTTAPTTHPYSAPRTQPSPAASCRPTPPPEPLAVQPARLAVMLDASVQRFLGAADHNLGHLETQVAHDVQALLNETLRRGAQAKADATPPGAASGAAHTPVPLTGPPRPPTVGWPTGVAAAIPTITRRGKAATPR